MGSSLLVLDSSATVATLVDRPERDNAGVGETAISRESVAYYGGQLLDLYEPENPRAATAVVLWHGSGANERDVLEPLARQIAGAGVRVVVPDWCHDDADGRTHLRSSLSFVQDLHPEAGSDGGTVLAGWSRGASAGLDVVRHPACVGGWRPTAFVGISGGFAQSPFSPAVESEPSVDPAIPLVLIHGSADEVVPLARSLVTYDRLLAEGWSVTLREVPADHAGAIGTKYDPARQRCVPSDDSSRRGVLVTVAAIVAGLALAGA
jgi:predicted esterase